MEPWIKCHRSSDEKGNHEFINNQIYFVIFFEAVIMADTKAEGLIRGDL